MNERITEDIVREHFKQDQLVKASKVTIEEQKSANPKINKLLQNASKKGSGIGKPEFIISFKDEPNLLLIVECKSDIRKHESATKDKYVEYAVDGVLLYSSFLSKSFDVIAVAFSGESKKDKKVSHFLQLQNNMEAKDFLGDKLLTLENYIEKYKTNDLKLRQEFNNLTIYSKELNEKLHKLKIKESLRSLLISGILLALRDDAFKTAYEKHKKPEQLTASLISTIVSELKEEKVQNDKIQGLKREYSFIQEHGAFAHEVNILKDIIKNIDDNLNKFIKTYKYHDVLGEFYIEFLRYANSDKGLGIVLTPPHITELFVDVAKVNKDSVIFDNCCGTGGFLISAMKKMIDDAKGDAKKTEKIKNNQLVGIEYQNDIFALALSNMFIHGDGSSSIFKGDCFNPTFINEIKEDFKKRGLELKPNVGLLNPPYKNIKDDTEEFEFILNNLEMLATNGICIAIIPMSCVTATDGVLLEFKKTLMKNHTLDAAFSMPNELFFNSNVGTICAIVVFTAHKPHPPNKETFLGYWKNDEFVKTRRFGRIDYNNKWKDTKDGWLEDFENNKTTSYSLSKKLKPEDEWCVEAYMKTDYSHLTDEDFIKEIKDYATFKIKNAG